LHILDWIATNQEIVAAPKEENDARQEATPALDRTTAIERLGGDEDLFAELAGLFRVEGVRMIQEIRQALSAGDPTAVQRAAHGLKGAAGYLGGNRVAEAAHKLELIGASRDLAAAPEVLLQLEEEIDRLLSALSSTSLQAVEVS
jgi:HPt (histidine-containing phosphotransfer) domain-containing protein